MSYKTELQNNNTRLRGVVDKINALPNYVEPGEGFVFGAASSGFVGVYGVATSPALTFSNSMFASSASGELTS